jgi:lambda family phage minor tail protein L
MTASGLTQKLIVNSRITLFQIDLSNYGGDILYLHGHQSFYDEIEDVSNLKSEIIWQGVTYYPIPIVVSGLEQRTDGAASKPKLSVGNTFNGVSGGLTALALRYKEFAGSKITIIDTFTKYLDAANFHNGNQTASNDCFTQEWYFQQMVNETDVQLDFELSNILDQDGLRLPNRSVDQLCHWAKTGKYRGEECGYTGTAFFDLKDNPIDDPALDECAGWRSSCSCRFGENGILRHGGFVTAGII